MSKFLTIINGVRRLASAITSSAGNADASKLVATKSDGKLDNSFVDWASPGAIGSSVANTLRGITLQLTGNNQATSTTTGDITARGAGFTGNVHVGGTVTVGGVQVLDGSRWNHTATTNPTTRPDGSALQVGDRITVPVSQGLRGGDWIYDSNGRWVAPQPEVYNYVLTNNSQFASALNMAFPLEARRKSSSNQIDYVLENVYIHGGNTSVQSNSSFVTINLRAEVSTDTGFTGAQVTIFSADTKTWTTANQYNTLEFSPNTLLSTAVGAGNRFWRLSTTLSPSAIGSPGGFLHPQFEMVFRRVRG
jgi:hypothetical protein